MRKTSSSSVRLVVAIAIASSLLAPAQAQSLLTTNGKFVVWPETEVPEFPGVYFAGNVDFSTVDENGTLVFRADMYGAGTSGINSRALFKGNSAATLAMVARWNDPAPGLPGLSLMNPTGTQGIHYPISISPSGGYTIWSSWLSGPGVTTANDSVMFRGSPGGHVVIAREGDSAPGTVGATYFGTKQADYQFAKINRNGNVLFSSQLAGGDVVANVNDFAYFTGTPGAISMMLRQGDTVLPGPVTAAGLGSVMQLDNNGRVLYTLPLAGVDVNNNNNDSIWLYTPGMGHTLLVREGDAAPGTAGATILSTADQYFPGVAPTSLTRSGRYVFATSLSGGDATPGANDRAVYTGMVGGGLTMIVRSGQAAPGTDAFFSGFSPFYSLTNDAGDVAFQALVTGGTSDTTNNSGIWIWRSGTLSKVVREGDPVAGMPGTTYDSFIGWNMSFNDLGQIVVPGHLRGGEVNYAVNANLLLAWDPVKGLFTAARGGEEIEGAPGSFRTSRLFGFNQFNNSDGVSLGLSKTGTVGLNVYLTDGTAAATLDLNCYPATVYGSDGDGDGYGDFASRVGVCTGDTPPVGYIPNATDCNDQDPTVFAIYWHDADGDGYGNAFESICDDATPPAGYVVKNTDCDDANPNYRPLAPDATCDNVDDNCNGIMDEDFVTYVSSCGVGACASSGVAQCIDNVFFNSCTPGTPSTETCNGVDDNCDGTVDNNIAAPTGTPSVVLQKLAGNAARLTWSPVAAATGYDVVRGGLPLLRSSGGDFTAATTDCLQNDLAATTTDDLAVPSAGQGFWYVLGAENCGGNASYNTASPRQIGSRDAEIAASGNACP